MMFGKRGELTSAQIVAIVLAVFGFVVVMIFVVGFDFAGDSDRELCRLSVLSRGSTPVKGTESLIPLNCVTEKICLTSDKGEKCEKYFAGEENVEVIVLDDDENEAREKIEEVSANAMYDCWTMMGEGRIDLFGDIAERYGLAKIDSSCVICSRIAVDESVSQNILDTLNINGYMRTHQVPGRSETYLQAFTDRGVSAYAQFDEDEAEKNLRLLSEGKTLEDDGDEVKIKDSGGNIATGNLNDAPEDQEKTREMAFVFMQIKSVTPGEVLGNMGRAGGTIAAGAFLTPGVSTLAWSSAKVVFSNPYTAIAAIVVAAGVAGYGSYNAIQGQLVAAGYCGEFERAAGSEGGKEGCSLVKGMGYDVDSINGICKVIEGVP